MSASRPNVLVQQCPSSPSQLLLVPKPCHLVLGDDPVAVGCRALCGPREGGDEGLFYRLHLGWIAGQRIPSDPVPAQGVVDEPDVALLTSRIQITTDSSTSGS